MQQRSSLIFSLFAFLWLQTQVFSQVIPERITLYSPDKYRVSDAPPMPNGQQPPDFSRASVDFRKGSREPGGDLSYGNLGNRFLVKSWGRDRDAIKDLGKLDWGDRFEVPIIEPVPELALDQGRLLIFQTGAPGVLPKGTVSNLPNVAQVILGHMYAVHVVNLNSDFYALVHVDAVVPGDNCTISWKILSDTTSPKAPVSSAVPKTAEATTTRGSSLDAAPATVQLTQPETRDKNAASTALERPALLNGGRNAGTVEKPRLKPFGSSLDRLRWDPDKQASVEIGDPGGKDNAAAGDEVVRVETRLVVSSVLVLDEKGRAVKGLQQDDFVVTEDGSPQPIGHFSLGDAKDVGRSIVLLLDYSESLLPYIETSATAAKNLVDQLGPKDRMAIVTDDVELLVDFTHDQARLKATIDSLVAKTRSGQAGKSLQFSALLATLREMFDEEDIRPIVIFQTDGDQIRVMRTNTFPFGLNDVNATVEKSRRATIYTVIPGPRLIGLSSEEQITRLKEALEQERSERLQLLRKMHPELPPSNPVTQTPSPPALAAMLTFRLSMSEAAAGVANLSGGETFFLEQPGQAGDIYAQILANANQRYVIGYYPTNKVINGKRRRVIITVRNHPEYSVEGRKSYIAN